MPFINPGDSAYKIPNPEADTHYRWLNSSDKQRMAMHLRTYGPHPGFKLVKGKTVPETRARCESLGLSEDYVDESRNQISYGESVLACIPMGEQIRRRSILTGQQKSLAASAEDSYMAKFEGINPKLARPFIRHPDEQADRKQFETQEQNPTMSLAGVDVPAAPVKRGPGRPRKDSL